MTLVTVEGLPWVREHDPKTQAHIPHAPLTCFPSSLEDLIQICRRPRAGTGLHAAGSHWALCEGAVSDHTFIETHDRAERRPAMGRTLTEVVPSLLTTDYLKQLARLADADRHTLVHIEAGKRIYQLYAELDQPVSVEAEGTLARRMAREMGDRRFGGSWGFATLGAAGGQTVVGALTTGTHGGDFDRPPVADSVVAIHLVADGGRHYWIEPAPGHAPLADEDGLIRLYGDAKYGGPDNFQVLRDDDLFDAVLVGPGRFGVIYAVVLKAVPQYNLYERRRLHVWQDIKGQISKTGQAPLYADAPPQSLAGAPQRFLQVVVCLTPMWDFSRNLAGVTKRWTAPLAPPTNPPGRAERVGRALGEDPMIGGVRFEKAGRSNAYALDPDDNANAGGFLGTACSSGQFLIGVVEAAAKEIEDFLESHGGVVGEALKHVLAAGGDGARHLLPFLDAVLQALRDLLGALDPNDTLGSALDRVRKALLDNPAAGPLAKAAGLLGWQTVGYLAFSAQQGDRDLEAISYAVMDNHDYLDRSCNVNVDSIEVVFDAADDRVIAFIDGLIAYERLQEFFGRAFVGYAALRVTQAGRALLAPQQHAVSAVVEVACLRDVEGSQELLDFAVGLARRPEIGGVFHWGQRNDCQRGEIEAALRRWREQLARITDGGRLDGFSNVFSRQTGLEVE